MGRRTGSTHEACKRCAQGNHRTASPCSYAHKQMAQLLSWPAKRLLCWRVLNAAGGWMVASCHCITRSAQVTVKDEIEGKGIRWHHRPFCFCVEDSTCAADDSTARHSSSSSWSRLFPATSTTTGCFRSYVSAAPLPSLFSDLPALPGWCVFLPVVVAVRPRMLLLWRLQRTTRGQRPIAPTVDSRRPLWEHARGAESGRGKHGAIVKWRG